MSCANVLHLEPRVSPRVASGVRLFCDIVEKLFLTERSDSIHVRCDLLIKAVQEVPDLRAFVKSIHLLRHHKNATYA